MKTRRCDSRYPCFLICIVVAYFCSLAMHHAACTTYGINRLHSVPVWRLPSKLSSAGRPSCKALQEGAILVQKEGLYSWPACMTCRTTYAKNKIVARFIPFSALGFWVKSTRIYAGAMPYRRDFTVTTRI